MGEHCMRDIAVQGHDQLSVNQACHLTGSQKNALWEMECLRMCVYQLSAVRWFVVKYAFRRIAEQIYSF